jgi:hypothetical protein
MKSATMRAEIERAAMYGHESQCEVEPLALMLLAVFEVVTKLHHDEDGFCATCQQTNEADYYLSAESVPWPCDTARAMGAVFDAP